MFDASGTINLDEAAVMRPEPLFVLYRVIEQPIYNWIQDHAFRAIPWTAGTVLVDPDVEHLFGRSRNCTSNGDIGKLGHIFFLSFSVVKNSSRRSTRAFQN